MKNDEKITVFFHQLSLMDTDAHDSVCVYIYIYILFFLYNVNTGTH
jgi:hypothetical protein